MHEELAWRAARLRAEMADAELDGLLAFAPGWRRENVRYLTGATLREAFAFAYLPPDGPVTAFVASAQDEQATRSIGWVDDIRQVPFPDCREVALALKDAGASRVGLAHLELVPNVLLESIRQHLPRIDVVSATALMDRVRLVKSTWELGQIRRAGKVCSAAWQALVGALAPGVREYEVVAAVEAEIKRLGAQDNFMLFASGGDDVMGMTPPGPRRLQPGDMVLTESTPQRDGY